MQVLCTNPLVLKPAPLCCCYDCSSTSTNQCVHFVNCMLWCAGGHLLGRSTPSPGTTMATTHATTSHTGERGVTGTALHACLTTCVTQSQGYSYMCAACYKCRI
jgi:hypothetical protein